MSLEKIKKNILRAILIILLIANLWVIFGFSNQNGEESGSLSKKVTQIITQNIKSIQNLEQNQKEKVLNKIEHIVRKLAHFTLYTSIGFLTMSLMSTYKLTNKKRVALSLCIGSFYAISDEIHQIFVPNRGPEISDVLIDTSGVIFGVLIAIIIIRIVMSNICRHNSTKINN